MTSLRRPFVIATVVLAGTLALAACSSSGSGSKHTGGGSSQATNSTASSSGSSAASTTGAPPTSSSTEVDRGTGEGNASGKPIGKQTIQGVHVTYNIDIYGRETTSPCTDDAVGSDLVALLTDNKCMLTRTVGVTTVSGHRIGVAEAVLHLTGAKSAATRAATQVAILLTNSASDGVHTPLSDGFRLPAGPMTVPANAARNAVNNGAVVTVVQAWYLTGSTPKDDPRLNETVEDISAA